jgi:hypothetical protein
MRTDSQVETGQRLSRHCEVCSSSSSCCTAQARWTTWMLHSPIGQHVLMRRLL